MAALIRRTAKKLRNPCSRAHLHIEMGHLSNHRLERYHLGMVNSKRELRRLENHVITCARCAHRAEQVAEYVDTIRRAIIVGDFDLLPIWPEPTGFWFTNKNCHPFLTNSSYCTTEFPCEPEGTGPMGANHNPAILVVDDDQQVLRLFARILTNANYPVLTAESGYAALEILNRHAVRLVVLDLNMPEPDGFDLLKALRFKRPDLKILVTSGFLTGPMLKTSELVGATASLSKADAPKHLLTAVNRLLG